MFFVLMSIHHFWRSNILSISSSSLAKPLSKLFSFLLAESQTYTTNISLMHETCYKPLQWLKQLDQETFGNFDEEPFLKHRRFTNRFEVWYLMDSFLYSSKTSHLSFWLALALLGKSVNRGIQSCHIKTVLKTYELIRKVTEKRIQSEAAHRTGSTRKHYWNWNRSIQTSETIFLFARSSCQQY